MSQIAYKVVITEYINGVSLEEWLDTSPSKEEREKIYEMVKAKIDTMHGNGIIHDGLKWHSNNIILKQDKAGNIIDVVITDFVRSYDIKDKKMWDYNKWIQQDRYVLDRIKSGNTYSFDNADDVTNYVTMKLRKHITVV
jgi:tRNA A-37 threonylcarbamoyl transferase component Bud32